MGTVFVVLVLLLVAVCQGSWVHSKELKDEAEEKKAVVVKECVTWACPQT